MEYIITKVNQNIEGVAWGDYSNVIKFKNAVDCYNHVCNNRIVVFKQNKNLNSRLIADYILGGFTPYFMRARMYDKMYKELMEI